jgi:hypothetical protein
MKKIIRLTIQDGERSYDEFHMYEEQYFDEENYADGYETAIKYKHIYDITDKELEILKKFDVI